MEQNEKTLLRTLYSMRDFQLALSAADFLQELEADKQYSLVELRRFKSYETSMIVSYGRPFSSSRGNFPRFSFDMIGMELTSEQLQLHEKLIRLRDQAIAHSDKQLMRIASKPKTIDLGNGDKFRSLDIRWAEGVEFHGEELRTLIKYLREIANNFVRHHYEAVQSYPEKYDIYVDYMFPEKPE